MLIALLAVLGVNLVALVAFAAFVLSRRHDDLQERRPALPRELLLGPYLEPVGTTAATSEGL